MVKVQLIKLLVHFNMRSLLIIAIFCLAGVRLSTVRKDQIGENEKLSLHDRMERMEREIEEVRTENKELRAETRELQEKIREVRTENKELRIETRELQEKIDEVRNPPFGYFCSYQEAFAESHSVITYDRMLYSSQFGLQGDSPGIDISTGKFVSGFSGTWRVDFSLYTDPDPGEYVEIFLYKNGEQIPETRFYSKRSPSVSGYDYNTGGRSVQLHLDLGDQLYLATTFMEDTAHYIIFCVSLEQFDV